MIKEIEGLRLSHLSCFFAFGSMEHKKVMRSMERFTGEVLPKVEKHFGTKLANIGAPVKRVPTMEPSTIWAMATSRNGGDDLVISARWRAALNTIGPISRAVKSRDNDCSAFVIACYSDPGLHAAREVTTKPVLGIAECGIVSTSDRNARFADVFAFACNLRDSSAAALAASLHVIPLSPPRC